MLGKVDGVKGFTSTVDEERGVSGIKVVVDSDASAQKAINLVKEAGLQVLSHWRQQSTLEEVFVALVGRGFREREHEVAA